MHESQAENPQPPERVLVPPGVVLVTFWSDWFSSESGFSTYDGGSEVKKSDWDAGKVLKEGEVLEASEKFRDDKSKANWDTYRVRVTNKGGKAVRLDIKPSSPAQGEKK